MIQKYEKEKNLKANFVGKNLIKNINKRYLMVTLNFMDLWLMTFSITANILMLLFSQSH